MDKQQKRFPTDPPPGVPLDQTMAPVHYEGVNMDEPRPWVRVWEWLTRPSPPKN
jgi:hypothetical protein